MVRVTYLDHLVLTVRDIEATISFYERVLGMEARTFDHGRTALHFGKQKINLHLAGHEFEPKANKATPGSADLCFIIDTPIEEFLIHLAKLNLSVELGVVKRTGALGTIRSVYIRDPDGNLLEIANYEDL